MPSPLRIRLTDEEEQCIFELRTNSKSPRRTKERAEALCLNSQGWTVRDIATYQHRAPQTIRQTIYRWLSKGIEGLFDAPRPGRKPRWTEDDLTYLENCLEKEKRTYNSYQLVKKLARERSVNLSSDRLRRLLKKKLELEKNQNEQ